MSRLEPYSFRHDGCIYTFELVAELASHASAVEGRKVFKDVERLRIRIPSPFGIPKQENCDEITEDLLDRKGLHDEYAKWRSGEKAVPKGMPITDFEEISAAVAKTLEASGVPTVEAFIETDGALLSKVVGPTWRELVEVAKALVGFTVDEGVKKLREDNVTMKSELENMRLQIAALTAAKPAKKQTAEASA